MAMTMPKIGLHLQREDMALLIGGAAAVYGIYSGNTTLTEIGLAVALGGKALGSVGTKPVANPA